MEFIIAFGLIILAFFTGRYAENSHYKSIRAREQKLNAVPAVSARSFPIEAPVEHSELVYGSVVVSVDYFKRVLMAFRQIFGGEIKSYAPLLDRGRREALLRMKEAAPDADIFVNCRLETSSIANSNRQNSLSCVEIIAYGTAIRYKK
ncbi:MAG: heavy metal-binding domain-containing protein [Bdellovibrionaceae bacterium]|nr:heavy metal-binding domain-containing protein [Bdellovibrionales bacterium]MCB9254758.1 heavy metal-binding domain-containing protein [Pseudobdellovibrionaceae bacterium]